MSSLMEQARKKRQALSMGGEHYKFKDGKNTVRLLPSWQGVGSIFWTEDATHYMKVVGSDKPVAVAICTAKAFGEPCGICDALALASRQADEGEESEKVKQSASRAKTLMNAVVDGNIVILELGPTIVKPIMALLEDEDYGDVSHPETGREIHITKTGAGINTEYSVMPAAKVKPVDPKFLESIVDLEDYVRGKVDNGKIAQAIGAANSIVGGDAAILEHSPVKRVAASVPKVTDARSDFDDDIVYEEATAGGKPEVASIEDAAEAKAKAREEKRIKLEERKRAYEAELAEMEAAG